MILRSESISQGDAGFTLLEALISLTILSLATVISIAALKGPSPALQLQRDAAKLQSITAKLRHKAVTLQEPQDWSVVSLSCDPDKTVVRLFPNGTASGPDLCLTIEDKQIRLTLDPLSGRYKLEDST